MLRRRLPLQIVDGRLLRRRLPLQIVDGRLAGCRLPLQRVNRRLLCRRFTLQIVDSRFAGCRLLFQRVNRRLLRGVLLLQNLDGCLQGLFGIPPLLLGYFPALISHHDHVGPIQGRPLATPFFKNRGHALLDLIRLVGRTLFVSQTRRTRVAIDGAYGIDMQKIRVFGELQPEVPILEKVKGFIKPAARIRYKLAHEQHGMHRYVVAPPERFPAEVLIEIKGTFRWPGRHTRPIYFYPHPRVGRF